MVLRQKDWVMVLPRKVAGGLMNKLKAKPLTCSVGEPCCGTVGSSETLLEYLTGIKSFDSDSCKCAPQATEVGHLDQRKTNLYIGRIIKSQDIRSEETMLS